MSWNEHHSMSERLASTATDAARRGDTPQAERLYREAAHEEVAALDSLAEDKQRTRGITAVSAVALWYKGGDYTAAERLAYKCLSTSLPPFAEDQLRSLLNMIWSASTAARAGFKFMPGDVLVSVKGGEVVHGGAPLELIIQKVETIQAVLFRSVEMLLDRPFRRHGAPPFEIQTQFRPWLFQAPPGSYQFAVRVQEPEQRQLFGEGQPNIERITTTFFNVLRASATDPETELLVIVPNKEYRGAFLRLSRNLAPVGKTSERVEVSDASSPGEPVATFGSDTRQELNSALSKMKPPVAGTDEPETIRGTLRAVHLDQDWLEVATSGEPAHVRLDEAGEALDDVVGPMVNRRVLVHAVRRGNKHLYRDIELEE